MGKRRAYLILIDTLCFFCVCGILMFRLFGERFREQTGAGAIFLYSVGIFLLLFLSRMALSVYNRVWRYASYGDYLRIILADFSAGVVCLLLNRFAVPALGKVGFSASPLGFLQILSIISVDCIAVLTMRFVYQRFYDLSPRNSSHDGKIGIAIVGAGSVGVSLAKDLLANRYSKYKPICFVDINSNKIGNSILDIPIIAEDGNTLNQLRDMDVREIVIAIPKLSSENKNEKYELYSKSGLKVKLYDYPLDDRSNTKRRMRDIQIEDLLFRNAVDFEDSASPTYYTGKTVLISGGGGSIGSELCRQIAKISPKRLIILDIYENNAYDIQQSLLRRYGKDFPMSVEIASVRDQRKLEEIFSRYRPDIVLHAAAHKHVPLMEDCPSEAIKNNVFGTYKLACVAEKYGVKKFIMISTDKAVNPTNVMGATKRLCEMITQSKKNSATEFVAVRFGNVLGSNGSVIPLFKRQIESGGPVTVTDKRVIRYFMTIPEAARLVLEAGAMASRSEIYVLDMGKPVKILSLAENMIRLYGLVPYEDIDIVEIGLRPGEKLYEELLIRNEEMHKTDNSLIFVEKDTPISEEELEEKLDILRKALETQDNDTIRKALMRVVPTYHTPEEVNCEAQKSREMKLAESR